jgi:hypothetical protein
MAPEKETGQRSKFTPTGNEQGSAAVQPGGHRDNQKDDTNSAQDKTEVQGSADRQALQEAEADDPAGQQSTDSPGLFSALVGNGKRA